MTTPDELLPLVDQILNLVGEDRSALERWGQTADGQKVIQYVMQIGKYPTDIGQGKDLPIGDCPAASVQGDWVKGDKICGDKIVGNKIIVEGDRLSRSVLEEIRDLLQSQLAPAPPEIDWQKASRSLLNEQIQRLTTNPLTRPENITLQTEQVYVPLGLVERKKVSRRGEDVSPEQGSLLYEETEITRKFEHEDFLEQVLLLGQSPRSGGRRIAVIGEPGAGKTTLLQQMARWVAEKIEGARFGCRWRIYRGDRWRIICWSSGCQQRCSSRDGQRLRRR
jgi:Effector-associated domain 10